MIVMVRVGGPSCVLACPACDDRDGEARSPMKLLVTGAGGMLGRDVMLAAGNAGHDVVGFGHTELDISDAGALSSKFELERPDVVINCAAWTDVDGAEASEEEALV